MAGKQEKVDMLYGFPKYEVQGLADDILRDREAKRTKPKLYAAALKLLRVRKIVLDGILKSSTANGKE